MDELIMNIPESLRMHVMDFSLRYETMHTGLQIDDYAQARLGHSDLCFAIDAPLDFKGGDTQAFILIYLDPEPYSRVLPEHGYQLVYAPSPWADNFFDWYQHSMQYLREAQFGTGFICTDLADFRQVLEASRSQRLHYELIGYDNFAEVPYSKLEKIKFKNLFAIIFGGADVSLTMYTDLMAALEIVNPNINILKLGMNFFSCEPPLLMLLGETED